MIPFLTLSIDALTDQTGENPTGAVQYCVVGAFGERHVYGDQGWVASGQAVIDAHPGGHVEYRTVTISYGAWVPHA